MLGGLRVVWADKFVDRIKTQKATNLLAFLALNPRRSHPREELVELLWPDTDPTVSRLRLNQVLSSLRRQFEQVGIPHDGLIHSDRENVGLESKCFETDVLEFEILAGADADSTAPLERAVHLYRGDLLPGVYDDWAIGERNRLVNLHAYVLERLCRLYRKEGRLDDATATAIKLVAIDPLREDYHLALIRLYGIQGRPLLAHEQFRKLEEALAELGDKPSGAAHRAFESIRSKEVHRRLIEEEGPLEQRPNLPLQVTRFVGRDAEVEAIGKQIREETHRLLTLTGPGGVGKTRLSLELGFRLADVFGPAIYFVSLREIAQPEGVADAILGAMNLPPAGGAGETAKITASLLRGGRSLLILDNMEHVVVAAPLVGELMKRVPGLTVLATSRVSLGLQGEQVIEVEPLTVPPASSSREDLLRSPSVQLFVDRARLARADFALTEGNSETIQAICYRLEGLPLALELAAGQATLMSPSEMLMGLESRFELLKSRKRDVSPRNQSLYDAIDYGFALLQPETQWLLSVLAVFQGEFSEDAASALVQPRQLTESLTELIDHSMVKVRGNNDETSVRFTMLESLREYALTRLDPVVEGDLRDRHARFFASLAEAAAKERHGPKQSIWLAGLALDHQNLLAALEWLKQVDPAKCLQMACTLDWYWEAKGHLRVGQHWIESALECQDFPALVRGRALNSLSWMSWYQTDLEKADKCGEEAQQILRAEGDASGLQDALYNLGVIAFKRKDFPTSSRYLAEAQRLAEAEINEVGVSRVLMLFGNIHWLEGDLAGAKGFYEGGLRIDRRLGNQMRTCFALSNLGGVAMDEQEFDAAALYYGRCITLSRQTGHRSYEGVFCYNLGMTRCLQGLFDEARAVLRQALAILRDTMQDHFVFLTLWEAAKVATNTGDIEAAATFWGIAEAMMNHVHLEPSQPERFVRDEEELVVQTVRSSPHYKAARVLGKTMSDSDAAAFAFSWLQASDCG